MTQPGVVPPGSAGGSAPGPAIGSHIPLAMVRLPLANPGSATDTRCSVQWATTDKVGYFLLSPLVNIDWSRFPDIVLRDQRSIESGTAICCNDEQFGLAYGVQQGVLRISRSTVSAEALRSYGHTACSHPVDGQRPGDLGRRRTLRTECHARSSGSCRDLLIRQFPAPDARIWFRLAVPPGNARVRVLAPVLRAGSS